MVEVEDWELEAVEEGLATRVGAVGEGVEDRELVAVAHAVAEKQEEGLGVTVTVTVTVPLEEADTVVVTVGVVVYVFVKLCDRVSREVGVRVTEALEESVM